MPNYEFRCCGVTIEIEARINDMLPKPTCMICNAEMKRIYQATPAVFKGTGWGKDVSSKR